ncbi:hypothetical protein [Sulfurimonas sp.]|uniref:tetratricopeptide repeat protein n=1 Tax=Sulfurimonas sp. TaxID=2022749 RepID=UPI002B47CA53|nr:hypothetical protein [Sulfurimonas sp.]
MILKYILAFLVITSVLQAKLGNCQVGDGKSSFVKCLVKEAKKTDSIEDINFLASFYAIDKEYDKSISWYKKSAEKGNAKAAFFLGGIYDEALDDKKEALKWYKKSAMQDYDDAMQHLNETMENVYGKSNTIEIYEKAIKKDEDVYWNKQFLANFYFRVKEYTKREEILKELIKEFPEQKADWFTMIADAYTKNYMNNKEMENKYYHQAAEFGSTNAMHNIGLEYGNKGDYKTAEMWFRKADENKMVCLMYKEIIKDKVRALECYQKEAESGKISDIGVLAQNYSRYKEYDKARILYEKLVKRGDSIAALNLGVLYHYIYKDNQKYIKWYKKAASMGNQKAIKYLIKKGLL